MTCVASELRRRVVDLSAAGVGDDAGLALVRALVARAEDQDSSVARARLLERASLLLERYAARSPLVLAAPRPVADQDPWRARLAARVRTHRPRPPAARRAEAIVSEIRASAATVRAAQCVAADVGPYNGAAVASRALDELAAIAPGYLGGYVAWLEDLAHLAALPECRPERRASRRRA